MYVAIVVVGHLVANLGTLSDKLHGTSRADYRPGVVPTITPRIFQNRAAIFFYALKSISIK